MTPVENNMLYELFMLYELCKSLQMNLSWSSRLNKVSAVCPNQKSFDQWLCFNHIFLKKELNIIWTELETLFSYWLVTCESTITSER